MPNLSIYENCEVLAASNNAKPIIANTAGTVINAPKLDLFLCSFEDCLDSKARNLVKRSAKKSSTANPIKNPITPIESEYTGTI